MCQQASAHKRHFLSDYRPFSHLLPKTNLVFELVSEHEVRVQAELHFQPNPEAEGADGSLVLNGAPEKREEGDENPVLELVSLKINGQEITRYTREGEELTIPDVPKGDFVLEVESRFSPSANKALSGLYLAGDKLLTQCESTGFRNIIFYPDRSDVLSVYTTTIIGDEKRFPHMVSNGDELGRQVKDGRLAITYLDATPKPSYLFALVAGGFDVLVDTYTIGSWRRQGEKNTIPNSRAGEEVRLEVYVEKGDFERGKHAMESLKIAMAMDERLFDREYDISTYRMVATNHFNMGAMENKGLNIFNSKYLLADPETATDKDYENIFRVIAHEYAHNWSGNRVTVKDWFEITLKEGFTNFRDQEMTGEYTNRDVKRIEDVIDLRSRQFPEDASANAHPIRPDSYVAVDNMYTSTIYEKGAEVIRMMKTLVGDAKFREGVNYYFEKNDGLAVRSDDFVEAIAIKGGIDLAQFKDTWYRQAGTPELIIHDEYDAAAKTYRLEIEQRKPQVNARNFPKDDPYHIPLKMGLLDSKGHNIPLQLRGDDGKRLTNNAEVLNIRARKEVYVFENVPEKPAPSFLRGFSAPVMVTYPYTREELLFLLRHDSDNFSRWEAGQQFLTQVLLELVAQAREGAPLKVDARVVEVFSHVLHYKGMAPAVKAKLLGLPTVSYLIGFIPQGTLDMDAVKAAYDAVREAVAVGAKDALLHVLETSRYTFEKPYHYDNESASARELAHKVLSYLLEHPENKAYVALAKESYHHGNNKTDRMAGLVAVVNHGNEQEREEVLSHFYNHWKHDPLMVNSWLMVQAVMDNPSVFERVKGLLTHEGYNATNPNAIRALLGVFGGNRVHFHRAGSDAYGFMAGKVLETDRFNPSVSSKLVEPLLEFEKYVPEKAALMRKELEGILAHRSISGNLAEKVENALSEWEGRQKKAS